MKTMQEGPDSRPRDETRIVEKELSLVQMIVAIVRRRRLIGVVTFLGLCASVLIALKLPDQYTATTTLMPPQQSKSSLAGLGGLGALADLGGMVGLKTPEEMYIGLLRAGVTVDQLIKKLDLKNHFKTESVNSIRGRLLKNVLILSDKKTGFISISAKDGSREFSAKLANAYVDALRNDLDRLAVTDAQQRRMFYQKQIELALNRLSEAEQKFEISRGKNGVVSVDGQVAAAIRASADLRGRISVREVQLQAMQTYATQENPDVQRILAEIAAMKEQLRVLEQGNKDTGVTANSDAAAIANIRAYQEVKYQEAVIDQLKRQLELARIDEAREGPLIQQIDVAVPPERKSGPHRALIVIAGGFLAFLFSVIYALIAGILAETDRFWAGWGVIRAEWRRPKH